MSIKVFKWFFFIFFFHTFLITLGQEEGITDKVVLKNGSILYGEILEKKENEFITLKISEETTLVIPFEEIKSLSSGKSTPIAVAMPKKSLPILYKDKGIYATYAGGLGFGNAFRDVFFMINTDLSLGYRWNKNVSAGMGIGSHIYPTSGNVNPLYVEFRGNLGQKRMSPMYYAKLGYAVRAIRTGLSESFKAGTFLGFGFGYREYTARKFGWMYSIGFQLQTTNQKWTQRIPRFNDQTGEWTFISVDAEAIITYNRVVWTWGLLF